MRWKAHQRKPQKSTTGRVGVQEGLTMEGIVRIKEPKTRTKQINTTKLPSQKVQHQQQQKQQQLQNQQEAQQQNVHDGAESRAPVKGEISQ